jgi:Phosphotransferase enzyme family
VSASGHVVDPSLRKESRLTAEPPRRAPVPADPALPRLAVLLDGNAMAPYLHRSLGRDAPFPDVRIRYVRYRAERKALVHYDVGLDGRRYDAVAMIAARPHLAERAVKPENVALARRVDGRSPARVPLRYEPELDALIQWYPLDLDLPTLAEAPTRLLDELEAAGVSLGEVGGDPARLGYSPLRRVVLRVGKYVLKIYAKTEDFAAATAANLFAAASLRGMRTAAFEGYLPGRLVTVQSLLSGSPPARAADVALEAGELLREFQAAWGSYAGAQNFHQFGAVETSARLLASSLPPVRGRVEEGELLGGLYGARGGDLWIAPPSHQLTVVEASARFVAAILPALSGRLQALLRELEETVPSIDRLVLSHGDFSARQLLVTPEGLTVVDFDALRLAPAALDPATYAAHLVSGAPNDLDDASEALEKLVEGFGGRPLGLSWYLATSILRHSRWPFRYPDEHWPERIEGMVTAAERALAR